LDQSAKEAVLPYTKFNADWQDSPSTATPITAAALEYIETGIATAQTTAEGKIDAEGARDTLATALVAGSNVTITPDDAANTITISSTGGGSGGGTAGVIYVNSLGATGNGTTNETTVLQNLINSNAGKIITFDPLGIYLVTQLILPSNTHLDLNGCTIRRIINTTGNTNGATIRNTNQGSTSTDVNITVRDGTIDYRNDSTGRAWSMNGVTGLRVSNLTIRKTSSTFADWMFHFENCIDVRVTECRIFGGFEVGEDGLHIKSTRNMDVTN
jgi:hypothetical protein